MVNRFISQSPQQIHETRVHNALTIVSKTIIVIALIWSGVLAYYGAWKFIWIEIFIMAVAAITIALNAKKYTRCAIYLLISGLYVCTLTLCLFLDLPNDTAPRTAHNYFLSVAFLSYWLLIRENKVIRMATFLIFMISFVVFSSSLIGFPLEDLGNTDKGRPVGAWINSTVAILLAVLVVYVFFSDYSIRTQVEKDLSLALPREQLELYYQGQVDGSGSVQGAEVLVRWNHPQIGVVSPLEFIPLAEKTGLIVSLGRQVLLKACEQLAAWSFDASKAHLTLSVNVSVQEFDETDFVDAVIETIEQTGINPAKLKLEITENILILNTEKVVEKMQALKDYGVTFSLDDFGTGFSSLNYLKSLPLSQLKIDRSFVSHMEKNQKDAKIVKSTISLGRDLGLDVIAEGVETNQQLAFLQKHKCRLFQGFLFSQALPKKEFEAFLADTNKA
ncbi:MAG: EAL domain-containing protein [Proteobacteria bacterium]|nr:EAL domain-containing protein [Pseudomonadota bacterium]